MLVSGQFCGEVVTALSVIINLLIASFREKFEEGICCSGM
jgi:hypothetical protein